MPVPVLHVAKDMKVLTKPQSWAIDEVEKLADLDKRKAVNQ